MFGKYKALAARVTSIEADIKGVRKWLEQQKCAHCWCKEMFYADWSQCCKCADVRSKPPCVCKDKK